MKIISTQLPGRYSSIILASKQLFPETHIWQPDRMSAYDMVDYVKPDVVLFDLKFVDNTLIQLTQDHRKIEWVLFGNGVPSLLQPHVVCAPPELSSVIRKHVENGEHKTVYLHDSANVVSIWGGKPKDYLKSDFSYYSFNPDPRLLKDKIKTLHEISNLNQKLIVVGPSKLPVVQYIGLLKEGDVSSLYKSSKLSLDFGGEQLLDIAANGGYALSNTPNKLFPNRSYDISQKERNNTAKEAQISVLNSDTCYHRLHIILEALSLEEAKTVWQKIEQIQRDAAV